MHRQAWWGICVITLLSPMVLMGPNPLVPLLFDMSCLIACLLAISSGRKVVGERFILSLTLPFLLASTYLVFQIIPQSPELLKILVPETWQNYQETIWKLRPGVWMPISSHPEATIYAWLHMCSLWSFCIAFSQLIDSHWRLFQLVKIFTLGVTLWSVLIIMTPVYEELSWWTLLGHEHIMPQLKFVLGFWVVIFLPVLFAGYMAFRSHNTHGTYSKRFRSILQNPEKSLQAITVIGLCLSCAGLFLLRLPVLWLTALTGYLLLRSLKSIDNETKRFSHKRMIHVVTCFCVISLIALIVLTPSGRRDLETLDCINATSSYFSWFGHGFGVCHTNNIGGEGGQPVVLGGGLIEIWASLGFIGTFILLAAMLALYHGVGGREKIVGADKIAGTLHSGGIASIVLLLITGSFVSLWQWYSMSTAIIYLTLFVTYCRRLSNLMTARESHELSKWTAKSLRGCVCFLLTASVLFAVLKTGTGLLAEQEVSQTFNSRDPKLSEDGGALWLKALAKMTFYDSDLSLILGQRYLIQKRDLEAKTLIWSALRLQPLSPQVHIAVASFSACTGDENTAMEFFSTKAAKNYVPDNTTKLLVARLLRLPESEAAIKLINLILDYSPQLAGLYLNMMTLYGYEPLALKSFFPEHPLIMLALGNLLVSKGLDEEAENAYWAAIYNKKDAFAKDENLYLHIARHFAMTDRVSEALLIVMEGRNTYPNSQGLKTLLKELNTQLGI